MLNKDEIVNLQYEIAMAIGSSLDVKRMLRECLSTIQRRLNCPVGGVFQINRKSADDSELIHILSIPLRGNTFPIVQNGIEIIKEKFADIEFCHKLEVEPYILKFNSNESLLIFNLADFGILYLYKTDQYYIEDVTRTLSPMLMKKLAISCKACLQNEVLEQTLSELKNAQSRMVQSEKMASLGILTAGVAHEINNPLNYLMGTFYGFINYFEDHGSQDSKTTNYLLESLEFGINRISDIVQGLSQFSHDNYNYDETCNIHSILDNCLVMLHNQLKYRIDIDKKYASSDVIVKGNTGKLHQAFLNILTNSMHAISDKGKIIISTETDSVYATIKIVDNGCGISADNIKKITDPFYTTKPPGEGTGLGLSITYTIIKEHGGLLEFSSVENKGTTAIIKIKL